MYFKMHSANPLKLRFYSDAVCDLTGSDRLWNAAEASWSLHSSCSDTQRIAPTISYYTS